ncbi:MAG: hypothetical protein QM813_12005 [Verrucomicrobiota bacterium]
MSVLPVHEPTSDFMRSNSGDAGLGASVLAASAAVSQSDDASNSVVQIEVMFVFMIFLVFVCLLMRLHEYNERVNGFRT